MGSGVGGGVGGGSGGGRPRRTGSSSTHLWYHSDGPVLGFTELRIVPAVYGSSYGLSVSRYHWKRHLSAPSFIAP